MSALRWVTLTGLVLSLAYASYLGWLRTRPSGYKDSPPPGPKRPAAGPLRISRANPRYFADPNGRPVYLTGSHTWTSLQDLDGFTFGRTLREFGGYEAYLDLLQRHHHNFIRLWTVEHAHDANQDIGPVDVSPLPYLRTGPGMALDGQPKFDLTRFNPAFFRRLRQRVQQAANRGIYVSIMLFDSWSTEHASTWAYHPFNAANNVNGINGDSDGDGLGKELHALRDPGIFELQKSYIRSVVDAVNDFDNVLFETANESGTSRDWHNRVIEAIRQYEQTKPKQHPVGIGVGYPAEDVDNAALFTSSADWVSPSPEGGYIEDPPAASGAKVILADTDHFGDVGDTTNWVWKSFTRGLNPIYMDDLSSDDSRQDARKAMGATRIVAESLDLNSLRPMPELSSSRYCLADPGQSYLVYIPALPPRLRWKLTGVLYWRQTLTLDLSRVRGHFLAEWISPSSGNVVATGSVQAPSQATLKAPRPGPAVLRLTRQD